MDHFYRKLITFLAFWATFACPVLSGTPTHIELRGNDLTIDQQGVLVEYGVLKHSVVLKRLVQSDQQEMKRHSPEKLVAELGAFKHDELKVFVPVLQYLHKLGSNNVTLELAAKLKELRPTQRTMILNIAHFLDIKPMLWASYSFFELCGSNLPEDENGAFIDTYVLGLCATLEKITNQHIVPPHSPLSILRAKFSDYCQDALNEFVPVLQELSRLTRHERPTVIEWYMEAFLKQASMTTRLHAASLGELLNIRTIYRPAWKAIGKEVITPTSLQQYFENPCCKRIAHRAALLQHIAVNPELFIERGTPREVLRIQAHSSPITAVALSSSGNVVATADNESNICLWNKETGEQIRVIKSNVGVIKHLGFSPKHNVLVGSSKEGVFSWSLESGEPVAQITLKNVRSIAVLSGSVRDPVLYLIQKEGRCLVYNYMTGERLHEIKFYDYPFNCVAHSSNGCHIALGSIVENTIYLRNIATRKPFQKETFYDLIFNFGALCNVALNHDGSMIAMGESFGKILLWDRYSTVSPTLKKLRTHKGSSPEALEFNPCGPLLLASKFYHDKSIRFWNTQSGKELAAFTFDSIVTGALFTPNGRGFVTSHKDGSLRICSLNPEWIDQLAPQQLLTFGELRKELDRSKRLPASSRESFTTLPRTTQEALAPKWHPPSRS